MGTLPEKTKLIIFDMDGVLFDSEPYHARAERIMLQRCGISEGIGETSGKSHADIWCPLIERYGLSISQPELERWQNMLTIQFIKEEALPLHSGLRELLYEVHDRGIRTAVASSTARGMVEEVLSYYGIRRLFCCIRTGSDVERRKPYPDIYRAVLQECRVSGGEAFAVEDTDIGLEAALAAGIPCVGYRNPTSGRQELKKSCAVIEKISDILRLLDEAR